MLDAFKAFGLCFVPFFIAMDPIGIAPIFLALSSDWTPAQARRAIVQSIVTAGLVTFVFVFLGLGIMRLLGIGIPDFLIAGGVLLFVLAMGGLLRDSAEHVHMDPDAVGAVPLGVPLIAGPAALTTTVIAVQQYGVGPAAAAILVNLALIGLAMSQAHRIVSLLGRAGSKAFSKICYLLLAAIAVSFVRRGIQAFIPGATGP